MQGDLENLGKGFGSGGCRVSGKIPSPWIITGILIIRL